MKHAIVRRAALLALVLWTGAASAGETNEQSGGDAARTEARAANEAAARQAAESVREANRLDLDIRLIGPTSISIAGDRQGA